MTFGELVRTVTRSGESHFPVVDPADRITGIVSINDIRSVPFENGVVHVISAKDVATRGVVSVFRDDTLQQALDRMAAIEEDEPPVVDGDGPDTVMAKVSRRDIVIHYYAKSGG